MFVIISSQEPQYIHISKYLNHKKNLEYFFIKKNKKKKFYKTIFKNFFLSLKNNKFTFFLIYYFLKIIYLNKYSSAYRLKKQYILNYFLKKNKKSKKINIRKIKTVDEIKNKKNKKLIIFGSDYINTKRLKDFKEVYNIHLGKLPKYSGLKSFERMKLNKEQYLGYTIHTINESIDSGHICYVKKILNTKNNKIDIFYDYVRLIEDIKLTLEKIIDQRIKLKKIKKNKYKNYLGIEFNEKFYKEFLNL